MSLEEQLKEERKKVGRNNLFIEASLVGRAIQVSV
jgi:hypothetical protein